MQRSSYEIDHFSSYVAASQSWYRTFASFGSPHAAATSSAVTGPPRASAAWTTGSDVMAGVCHALRPAPERPSASDERRLAGAVLDEGLHADLAVLRREQRGELDPLDLQAGLEVDLEA